MDDLTQSAMVMRFAYAREINAARDAGRPPDPFAVQMWSFYANQTGSSIQHPLAEAA